MHGDLFDNTPFAPRRRGRPKVELSHEKQQLARSMLLLGMTQVQISEIFEISIPTLGRILSHLPEWNPRGLGPQKKRKNEVD